MRTPEEISNSFGFHPGTPEVVVIYQNIRNNFEAIAQYVNAVCPDSRELALALTHMEMAQMWAIKAVAVHQTPLGEEGTGYRG